MIEGRRFSGIADEGAIGIERQIALHRGFGWNSIELRTVGGENVCEMDDAAFDRVAGAVEDAGFETVAFGSAIANWSRPVDGDFQRDIDDLYRAVPRMRRLNCSFIRIMSYTAGDASESEWATEAIRRVRELTRIATGEGITLVHENCDGWASQEPERLARLLDEIPDAALQIVFDPGNPVAHGQDPSYVRRFFNAARERIVHFHVKDCFRDEDGVIIHCYPGDGQCRVAELVRELESNGYTGYYSIEPHMSVQIHKSMDGNSAVMAETYSEYARRTMALLQ